MAQGTRRSFGKIRKLPSGRYQASFVGTDGQRHNAPTTYALKADAQRWLSVQDGAIAAGTYRPTVVGAGLTVAEYAPEWLASRTVKGRPLAATTMKLYGDLLRLHILPTLGTATLRDLTYREVEDWHAGLLTRTGRARAGDAYALLHAILTTAIDREYREAANPCRLRGAMSTESTGAAPEVAEPEELAAFASAMPARYFAYVLVAGWCAMRASELRGLRRMDIDLKRRLIHVRRAVTYVDRQFIVKLPKTDGSARDIEIPQALVPVLEAHLSAHAAPGQHGLVFCSPTDATAFLHPDTLSWHWHKVRAELGMPTFRLHDARHTGATMTARAGATIKEAMTRLGHTTPGAALRYQHSTSARQREIADKLSAMVVLPESAADVVDLGRWKQTRGA